MPTPPLPEEILIETAEAYVKYGSTEGAKRLGVRRSTFESRVAIAENRGFLRRSERTGGTYAFANRAARPDDDAETFVDYPAETPATGAVDPESLRIALLRHPMSLDEIADRFSCSRGQALDAVETLRTSGMNVHEFGERWSVEKVPSPQHVRGQIPTYVSREDNTYVFGFVGDTHLCSKYARLDVLESLYDHFARIGVDRVFHTGNWVDGEASFNKHDLIVHGMNNQLNYLVDHYPRRPGIVTYAVTGDDHEGWWAQREGIDIGRYTQNLMQERGREDWIDLGYMEAYVRLQNASTEESTMLHVMHPGGGSAYAVSYTVQKIVEGYDGGDKPACLLAGHYHKLSYNLVRNVHAIQTGTTQDQTPFMRKKKLSAHVGGGVCRLTQDPVTGAITACAVEFFNYFVKDYYNARWSHANGVNLANRGA